LGPVTAALPAIAFKPLGKWGERDMDVAVGRSWHRRALRARFGVIERGFYLCAITWCYLCAITWCAVFAAACAEGVR
jgi:hypothetical protein